MEKKNSFQTLSTVFSAIIHIRSTFNNILISITDINGNVLICASPGVLGFKGSKRATSFAAQIVAETLGLKMLKYGISTAKIVLKGVGKGRNSAIMGFKAAGIVITTIVDMTTTPHNGCRPKKQRRI